MRDITISQNLTGGAWESDGGQPDFHGPAINNKEEIKFSASVRRD